MKCKAVSRPMFCFFSYQEKYFDINQTTDISFNTDMHGRQMMYPNAFFASS